MSKITLITCYYDVGNAFRQNEIDFCIRKNIDNKLIEKIVMFIYQPNVSLPSTLNSDKIETVVIKDRFKFSDAFNYANSNLVGDIVVVSNTDIFFDGTLCLLHRVKFDNLLISLTRKDYVKGNIVEKRMVYGVNGSHPTTPKYCHDSWIFKAPIKKFFSDIYLGVTNSEHYMTANAVSTGIKTINAYNLINSYHVHSDNNRSCSLMYKVPHSLKGLCHKSSNFLPLKNFYL